MAESGSPLWNVYFAGRDHRGKRFVKMFFMNGGHGARPGGWAGVFFGICLGRWARGGPGRWAGRQMPTKPIMIIIMLI